MGFSREASVVATERTNETTHPSRAKLRADIVGHQQIGGGTGRGLCARVGTIGMGGMGTMSTSLLELVGGGRASGLSRVKVVLSFDRYSPLRTSGRRVRVVQRKDWKRSTGMHCSKNFPNLTNTKSCKTSTCMVARQFDHLCMATAERVEEVVRLTRACV